MIFQKNMEVTAKKDIFPYELYSFGIMNLINTGTYGQIYDFHQESSNTKKLVMKIYKNQWCYSNMREMIIAGYLDAINAEIVPPIKCFLDNRGFIMEKYEKDLNSHFYTSTDEFELIVRNIIRKLCFFSKLGITHRDIKPDNIVINKNPEIDIRFIDWGLGRFDFPHGHEHDCDHIKYSKGICTLWFRPPELLCESYPDEYDPHLLDIWSTATTILYIWCNHLGLIYPFRYNTEHDLHYTILNFFDISKHNENATIYDNQTLKLSQIYDVSDNTDLVDLLDKMLIVNPNNRITIDEILKHPFIAGKTAETAEPEEIGELAPIPIGVNSDRTAVIKNLQKVANEYSLSRFELIMAIRIADNFLNTCDSTVNHVADICVDIVCNIVGNELYANTMRELPNTPDIKSLYLKIYRSIFTDLRIIADMSSKNRLDEEKYLQFQLNP